MLHMRSLDPQDVGLGVSADQSGLSGSAVSVPTCGLSSRMHDVWSPGGPKRWGCPPSGSLVSASWALALVDAN